MQKWCPDSFEPEVGSVVIGALGVLPVFESTDSRTSPALPADSLAARFRQESGFANDAALMSHLTREERATVFELAEIDVAEQYEIRAKEKEQEFQEQQEKMRRDFANWAESFQEETYSELRDISRSCIDLALQLAGKIIRESVALDPQALVRDLEMALFKVPAGQTLDITVNPEDETWLKAHPEILEKLRIGSIAPDRRIERGGCKVESRGQAWDATINGQLAALGEMIHELVATLPDANPIKSEATAVDPPAIPGGDDATPLD